MNPFTPGMSITLHTVIFLLSCQRGSRDHESRRKEQASEETRKENVEDQGRQGWLLLVTLVVNARSKNASFLLRPPGHLLKDGGTAKAGSRAPAQ